MTTGSCLGVDGEGIAAHWRITECPTFDAKGTHIAPTRDFERWDGTLFDDPKKTESRIPKGHTPWQLAGPFAASSPEEIGEALAWSVLSDAHPAYLPRTSQHHPHHATRSELHTLR